MKTKKRLPLSTVDQNSIVSVNGAGRKITGKSVIQKTTIPVTTNTPLADKNVPWIVGDSIDSLNVLNGSTEKNIMSLVEIDDNESAAQNILNIETLDSDLKSDPVSLSLEEWARDTFVKDGILPLEKIRDAIDRKVVVYKQSTRKGKKVEKYLNSDDTLDCSKHTKPHHVSFFRIKSYTIVTLDSTEQYVGVQMKGNCEEYLTSDSQKERAERSNKKWNPINSPINNPIYSAKKKTPGNHLVFVRDLAYNLASRDDNFDNLSSLSFILNCLVNGLVMGLNYPVLVDTTVYINSLKETPVFCHHSGVQLDIYRSQRGTQASPDRTVLIQLDDGKWYCPNYSDPLQITVRSSLFCQFFFMGYCHRFQIMNWIIGHYFVENGKPLDFTSKFEPVDCILSAFVKCQTKDEKRLLADKCDVDRNLNKKIKQIFQVMKSKSNEDQKGRTHVRDFIDSNELIDFFRCFKYTCMVSGIAWIENGLILSCDRVTTSDSRYNWTDVLPMLWLLNLAKMSMKKIFYSTESLAIYANENSIGDMNKLQVAVYVLRIQFVALVSHWYSNNGYNPLMDMSMDFQEMASSVEPAIPQKRLNELEE